MPAIWELLPWLNGRPMRKLGVSRRDLFEHLDRPALRPLPLTRYEFVEWGDATVNIDYHVVVDHNYYSVPSPLVHQSVEVRLSAATVELSRKGRRVASHRRRRGRGEYATEPVHMPQAHRAHAKWTPSRLIAWAETTGPVTAQLVAAILATKPHPEQGDRACLGILRLAKGYGIERLEAACARAGAVPARSYRHVDAILKHGLDRLPLATEAHAQLTLVPAHENLRGPAYYQ